MEFSVSVSHSTSGSGAHTAEWGEEANIVDDALEKGLFIEIMERGASDTFCTDLERRLNIGLKGYTLQYFPHASSSISDVSTEEMSTCLMARSVFVRDVSTSSDDGGGIADCVKLEVVMVTYAEAVEELMSPMTDASLFDDDRAGAGASAVLMMKEVKRDDGDDGHEVCVSRSDRTRGAAEVVSPGQCAQRRWSAGHIL